jgi:hypothetical protein
MNCANHADASAVAYCRTCGKPLCANCTRPVRGVIYCEDCLGAKVEAAPGVSSANYSAPPSGTYPNTSAGFAPGAAPNYGANYGQIPPGLVAQRPAGSSGPNPTVAGILAGFFPFGVGAVYTGQYAKGLAHLAVFAFLIAGVNMSDRTGSEMLGVVCGLGIAFFYVYQIIDAVRSARAIQTQQPIPDPFGLAATFGSNMPGAAKVESNKVPTGAIVLILIGVLFLLHTMGLTEFRFDRFWPLILIVLGMWMFARNWGAFGQRCTGCQCARCRARRLMGPSIVTTIGVLFLLENLNIGSLGFNHTWPVILLVIGAIKLLQNSASWEGHNALLAGTPPGAPGIAGGPPVPPMPPTVPPAAPASNNTSASTETGSAGEVSRG